MGVSDQGGSSIRRRYGVPDGITLRADGREVLAWVPGYEVCVREVAAHPDDLPQSRAGGRRPLARLAGPAGPVLVREFVKGGLLRHVRGRAFHGRWRPLEELVLHRRLRAIGVPVPDAVGCVILRTWRGWRGFLLLAEVEGGVDLEAWLHGGRAQAAQAPDVLHRAGRVVRRLHDAGVPHPDLHPKNLLLAPDGTVLLLDLDKARAAGGRLPDEVRLANLVRLGRAVEKHRLKGMPMDRHVALRFLEGYAGTPEAADKWLARIRDRLRRGLRWRQLWWRLSGQASAWRPPTADGA